MPTPVVFDVNVLVTAVASGNSPFRSWPSPPPVSGNASADCVGVANDADEFSLWVSPHIMWNVERALLDLFKWEQQLAESYLTVLVEIVARSGGRVVEPPRTVHDCPVHEDNLILDLAVDVGALLVVSNDTDLISMSPWRGTPIVTPDIFRQKVDGMRRHARHRR
ncbi:hypothetical protein Aple_015590 [Acrocarpospora pleiomorpha]|uniref:PIN domain-containing protein n=1 Tax=Acrocarpospora pleiomorpha TaxID=90975 RepID=A0A5M3XBX1_9ACTN|nr:PIN domain-containing protein [Acrocarpospora pleiomorpha]GES18664.1 hypothetical protein Aple_015590 [Acrocarpospora pleiomorpha]